MNANNIQFKPADDLLVSLGDTFKAAPKIPKGIIDFLVTIAPWIAIIFGVLTLISMVFGTLFGFIASFVSLLSGQPLVAISTLVAIIIGIVQGVLMVLSFKPLQKREMYGWKLMGYNNLLGALSTIVSVIATMNFAGLIMSAIFMAIGFWILFQMKPSYK